MLHSIIGYGIQAGDTLARIMCEYPYHTLGLLSLVIGYCFAVSVVSLYKAYTR